MTEHAVTPEEARTSIAAILLQAGVYIDEVYDYDPRTDRFSVRGYRGNDRRLVDCTVYGETVARAVHVARLLSNRPKGLKRPSEVRSSSR